MKKVFMLSVFLLSISFAQNFLHSLEFKEMPLQEQKVISEVLANSEVSDFIKNLDNWSAYAYVEGLWHVTIYEGEEWITDLQYDISSGKVKTDDLPVLLSKKQVAAYEANIIKYLFDDAEVKELFRNPNNYSKELVYHKFDRSWSYYLSNGLDDYEIQISPKGEDYFQIDGISNFNVLEADQKQEVDRNKAIELAYNSDKTDDVFDGVDDWYSYAEKYEDDLWMVEFAAEGKSLLFVLVDVANQLVLESKLP